MSKTPYVQRQELKKVFDEIESILPVGWCIDQRSQYIEVTWPSKSPEDSILRSNVINKIIEEITQGHHKSVLGDYKKFENLIDHRVEEAKGKETKSTS